MDIRRTVQSFFRVGRRLRGKRQRVGPPGGPYRFIPIKHGERDEPFFRNRRYQRKMIAFLKAGHVRETWKIILDELGRRKKYGRLNQDERHGSPLYHMMEILAAHPHRPYRQQIAEILNWKEILFNNKGDRSLLELTTEILEKIGDDSVIPLIEKARQAMEKKDYRHLTRYWERRLPRTSFPPVKPPRNKRELRKIVENHRDWQRSMDSQAFAAAIQACRKETSARSKKRS